MKLDALRFRYPGSPQDALGPLDLAGPPDRPWLLLGPSGAGKSTLLRVLAGQLAPTGGRITPRLPGTAYLPQFPERVLAGRNLAEDLSGQVRPPSSGRARLRDALASVGLPGKSLSTRNQDLSGGERRQVAHALLVLAGKPHWALDEPDAGLDRSGVDLLLAQLATRRASPERRLWIASHRFDLYGALNPWVVVLEGGRASIHEDLRQALTSADVHRILGLESWAPVELWTRYSGMGAERLFQEPAADERPLESAVRAHLLTRAGVISNSRAVDAPNVKET